MNKMGIDGMLITTEANFHYHTGLVSIFWYSPTRPSYLILPRVGDSPIAIVSSIRFWLFLCRDMNHPLAMLP